MRISEKSWGNFTESDYTPDQWWNACLIKPPKSEYTAKTQAKLPVLEPDGTLNRNGVIAAVRALAGARMELQASPEVKKLVALALIRYYKMMEMEIPEILVRLSK